MNIEKKLYQWDTEQKLTGCTGLYVDFPIGNEVYRVETADGTCIIPDELLQTSGSHKVYECMTNNTIRSFAFSVTPRPKPPDYVYTPTERLTFEGLVQRVDDAVADMIRRAESGEFDGHTPVKGTDYFTTGEIQQIQNEVSSGAIGEFKSVVDTETETFNTNAESKLTTYNENDVAKTGAYNTNASDKLDDYNTNASNKVTEYNSNAENKTAEFDTHTEQIQADISELKSDLIELSNTVNGEYFQYAFEWEVGRLDKGEDYVSNKYYRTKSGVYYEFTEPLTITVADGYTLTVERYSSEKVYAGRAAITISESPYIYPIDLSPYYRLQIKKNDGSAADATWLNGVTFESSLMNVGLVDRVETLENQSTSILNGKIWVSFGDSITAGNNLLETETNWSDRVATELGCTHINCGVGSSRVAGYQSTAFHTDARLDAVKNANPDIVTILGGANDLVAGYSIGTVDEFAKALEDKNKSTYLGAYSYIVENLLTWKPELDIVILGMYYAWNDGKDYSETNTYTDFSNASKQLAEYYGLPFVDLHNLLGFNQFTMGEAPYNTYTRDKIHPNDNGCEKIASVVKAKFIELFN